MITFNKSPLTVVKRLLREVRRHHTTDTGFQLHNLNGEQNPEHRVYCGGSEVCADRY